jgi:uncharacterized protein (DUF302 family)
MGDAATAQSGIVKIASRYDVPATAERLVKLLDERGITVFARIDFSADAARVGLAMRPQQLLLIGNPRAGTPLMVANPEVGLDLPLKALIWQDAQDRTWIAYNLPHYLLQRHALPTTFTPNLAAVIPLLEQAGQ